MATATTSRKQHDQMRFQFMFGSFDENHLSKPSESLTVTYVVPYQSEFGIHDLRKFVEAEHTDNINTAYRAKNTSKRTERLGIAKASIESIREWFGSVDAKLFDETLSIATHTRTVSWMDSDQCRLVMTPVLGRAYLD
jgi:hypothetical protein